MTITRTVRLIWRNPYITDGLIAHWDGLWNIGPDKHNPTSTVWTDLVNGTSVALNGQTFSENSLIHNRVKSTIKFYPAGLEQLSTRSYEFIFRILESECVDCNFIAANTTNNGFKHILINTNRIGIRIHNAVFGIDLKDSTGSTGCQNFATTSSATINNGDVSLYTSGKFGARDATLRSWNDTYFTFPNTSSIQGSNIYCELCAIRIYNRILSATEIATNYAIDKSRFHL